MSFLHAYGPVLGLVTVLVIGAAIGLIALFTSPIRRHDSGETPTPRLAARDFHGVPDLDPPAPPPARGRDAA